MQTKTATISILSTVRIPFAVYLFLAFGIPFLLAGPQIVVGTIVNAVLFFSALRIRSKQAILLSLAPSIGVFSRGLIFGPYTSLLLYLLPFIWFSNLVLINIYKKRSDVIGVFLSGLVKTALLYSTAVILFKSGTLPVIFLKTMGLIQLLTALIGGLIVQIIEKNKNAKPFCSKTV